MPDNLTTLVQQLAAEVESTKGTAVTLTASSVGLRPFSDINYEPQYLAHGNDEVADDIGTAGNFIAGQAARMTFGLNLRTGGVLGGPHAIARYLKGCGLKEQTVKTITVGTQSGGDSAFKAGETYSATGGKTGIIEKDLSGAGTLRYIVSTGGDLVASDVVTANGDSATTSGSTATYGSKYSPRSTGHETLTLQRGVKNSEGTASQDFLYRLRGAMGTFELRADALDVFKCLFEFQGVEDFVGAGSLFTGVTYEGGTPVQLPKLHNATIQINGVTVRPDAFSLALGNQIEMDPDPTASGGGTAGYDFARILRREPVITMTPYRLIPSVLDDLGLHKAGTTFPVTIIAGTTPYLFEFVALKAQISQSSLGTRAGRETNQLSMVCTRQDIADEEFALYLR
jgi:hypothetical protein